MASAQLLPPCKIGAYFARRERSWREITLTLTVTSTSGTSLSAAGILWCTLLTLELRW
jgi:hypothetical protein